MKIWKVEKFVLNLQDKKTKHLVNVVFTKNMNQALKHGLKLKKVHRDIRFEQNYSMKPYIMSTKFWEGVLNGRLFGKIMEKY